LEVDLFRFILLTIALISTSQYLPVCPLSIIYYFYVPNTESSIGLN
jgi:hypothetical protein